MNIQKIGSLLIILLCISMISCAPKTGNVAGKVVYNHSKAHMEGVTVTISHAGQNQQAVTDHDGVYSFKGLVPGEAFLKVRKKGYRQAKNIKVTVKENVTARAENIELFCKSPECAGDYNVSISGKVVDFQTGKPLPNTSVIAQSQIFRNRVLQTKTDVSGGFSIKGFLPMEKIVIIIKQKNNPQIPEWRTEYKFPDSATYNHDFKILDLLLGNRFFDRGDGTVIDIRSNLMWVKDTSRCGGPFGQPGSPKSLTWKAANDACGNLDFAGFTDWKMPGKLEWATLETRKVGLMENVFKKHFEYSYWTSATNVGNAWHIEFNPGKGFSSGWIDKNKKHHVRPVRKVIEGRIIQEQEIKAIDKNF